MHRILAVIFKSSKISSTLFACLYARVSLTCLSTIWQNRTVSSIMTQTKDVSNTEDENVTKTSQTDGNGDAAETKEKFRSKEPIALISIVCLSLCSGLSKYQESRTLTDLSLEFHAHSLSLSAVPVVGLVFAAFLSQVIGRKPVFQYLFALSVFSSILRVSSTQTTVICLMFILNGLMQGGYLVMNGLAISEYSSPKHRFAWMIGNVAALNIVDHVMTTMTWDSRMLFAFLAVIRIVLGLICLGLIWVCPESPYWLASKGKLEQSRRAFMWLRGKEGSEELASMLKARRRPDTPKLFCVSLFIALATISVSMFSSLNLSYSLIFFRHKLTGESEIYIYLFGTGAITCILAAMSYFVKRKLLFIVVSIISFILSYAETIWFYLASSKDLDGILFYLLSSASCVLQKCGPLTFGVILYIEIAPYKYNTTISCICFSVSFTTFTFLFYLSDYLFHFVSFHLSLLLALSTTFCLIAALLYYFFVPETKDKTLFEIQRSYTSDENDVIPDENQGMVLDAISSLL